MRKKQTLVALAALIAVPVLWLAQHFLLPRTSPQLPRHPVWRSDPKLMTATEEGLRYSRDGARHIDFAAAVYASRGEHRTAQNWFRLGAAEFRYPSVMLFYGDYLVYHKRAHEALRWYKLALFCARQGGVKDFAAFVRMRIRELEKRMAQEVKK